MIILVVGLEAIFQPSFKPWGIGLTDNNIDLCLDQEGIPIGVQVNENVAIDPNDDPNPKTEVEVLSRW